MSQTFQVSDGHVVFSASTGQPVMISGERKCSQDLAECLLQNFSTTQQYGSYLNNIVSNNIPGATELLVSHYVADAVSVLDQIQQQDPYCTADEKVNDIISLITTPVQNGICGYFVQVSTVSGQSASAGALPTSLNQQWEG